MKRPELRRLLADGTQGEWTVGEVQSRVLLNPAGYDLGDVDQHIRADAELIAAAVNELPGLLDLLDFLMHEIEVIERQSLAKNEALRRLFAERARDES